MPNASAPSLNASSSTSNASLAMPSLYPTSSPACRGRRSLLRRRRPSRGTVLCGMVSCVADDEGPAVTPFQDYEWVGTEFGDTEGRERNFKTVGQAVAVAVAVAVAATASRALSFT
ncbi:hypothetical protein HPP92_006649 [Vanilla planifolia]|uniref:Uncharacterized protein n=1 Tax=Vanilla planifolia TaxID=51239 RepID=A0A835RCI5_VANPL|nr:hypothetical protein HPP92_006649 [Vanilla planifolia]